MISWKKGDIFYIESIRQDETGRPAIIVSNNKVNDGQWVQAVYLTTRPKTDLSTHIDISSTKQTSVALCERISTVDARRIGEFIGTCSNYEMQLIDIALSISLDLDFQTEEKTEKCNKKSESVAEAPEKVQREVKSNDDVIKLTVERDTYKQLYENLLERMMK